MEGNCGKKESGSIFEAFTDVTKWLESDEKGASTIPLPPLSQSFAPLFRCLCSTSSSVSFISALSPIFLVLR